MMSTAFWHGKRVLVTGHTGFKGGWLVLWLRQLGATVCGIALPPTTNPANTGQISFSTTPDASVAR